MRRFAPVFSLVVAALLAGHAPMADAARAERLGVVPITTSNPALRKAARKATTRLVRQLRRQGYRVVALPASHGARLQRCLQQPSCAQELAVRYRMRLVVAAHAERVGQTIHLDMRVVDGQGRVISSQPLRTRHSWGLVAQGGRLAAVLLAQASRAPRVEQAEQVEELTRSDAIAAAQVLEVRDNEDPDRPPRPAPDGAELTESRVAAGGAIPVVQKDVQVSLWSKRYWHAWTTAGVGLAALGVGAAFGTISRRSNKAAQEAENQPRAWTLQDEAEKNALTANIMFAAGGAAVLTSAMLFYLEVRSERAENRHRLNLGVNIASGGGQVTLQGRF